MRPKFTFLVAAALVAVSPWPAAAQPLCFDRTTVIDRLSRDYAERPVAMGITQADSVLEILVSKNGRSWTVIVTGTTGLTCLIAAGKKWRKVLMWRKEPGR